MNLNNKTDNNKNYLLPLIIGAVLQAAPVLFLRLSLLSAVCTVLWPFFMLLAERRTRSKAQFEVFFVVFTVSQCIRFCTVFGTKPLMILVSAGLIILFALLEAAAFLADRLLVSGKGELFRTLVFPLLFTCANCIFTMLGFGDVCNPGAAIAYFPRLVQSASILIEHGLCFMLMWISSLLAFAVDEKELKKRIPFFALPAVILILSVTFGASKLSSVSVPDSSFRVAMCTTYQEQFTAIASHHSKEDFLDLIDSQLNAAADQGAELAVFCEEHSCFPQEDEIEMLDRISKLVSSYGIPVVLPLEISTPEGEKSINCVVFFDEDGREVLRCLKNNLVPVVESADYVDGPEVVSEVTLDIGGKEYTFAVVVCFDIGDAAFIRKMSNDVDVLICPSWEWYSCSYEQKRCAILRAVENGVTVIKPAQDGFSCIADPYGRLLSAVSTEGRYTAVEVAEVPVYHTEYGRGEGFEPSMTLVSAAEAVSFLMLLILSVAMAAQMDSEDKQSALFLGCLILEMHGLAVDAISYIYNGSGWSDGLCRFVNLMSYVFSDLIMICFALYFQALLYEKKKTRTLGLAIAMIAPLADIVFLIIGVMSRKLFSVAGGLYIQGPWDSYAGILPAVSILCVLVIAILNRRFLSRRECAAIVSYLILPLAASLSVFGGGGEGSLSYVAVALSLLIVYVLIQAGAIQKGNLRAQLLEELSFMDVLTRLKNRRAFDEAMSKLSPDTEIGIIFCDLNGLKHANDTYGHGAGDRLIVRFARILEKQFKHENVYRMSGDEFIAVMPGVSEERFYTALDEFKTVLAAENDIASAGGAYSPDAHDLRGLTQKAEKLMYAAKREYYVRKEQSD